MNIEHDNQKKGYDSNTVAIDNQQTVREDLVLLGYKESEIESIVSCSELMSPQIIVDIEDLISHMRKSSLYSKYPKSTVRFVVDEYRKQSKTVILSKDLIKYLDENSEAVDQELWINDNNFMSYLDNGSQADIYKISQTEEHQKQAQSKQIDSMKQDYRNLIAGILSSILSRTMVAPLDRLKMLYQVNYVGLTKPPSISVGMKEIYNAEGFRGYFRGNFVNILKGSPENGIRLYTFELTKWNLQKKYGEKLSNTSLFLSGALSGVLSTIVIFPLEVLKLRIAASPKGTYSGIIDALLKIYREPRGVFNFYSGLEASICAVIPNAGFNLTVYEVLKTFYSGKSGVDNATYLTTPTLIFIGGLSAIISSTVLYPFQIVQSRMIMHNLKAAEFKLEAPCNAGRIFKYKFLRSIYSTYKYDGIAGFYKGYVPAITKIGIGNGIGFGVYEKTKKLLGVNRN